jgi:hypothetical protein
MDGTACLCFWRPDGGQVTDDCYGIAAFSCGIWHSADNDEDSYREPTRWMPLPQPPKETE